MDGAQRQRKEINWARVKEKRAEVLVGKETARAPMKRRVRRKRCVLGSGVTSELLIQKYVYLAIVAMTFWKTSDTYGKVYIRVLQNFPTFSKYHGYAKTSLLRPF